MEQEARNKALHAILKERTKAIWNGICMVLKSEGHIKNSADVKEVLRDKSHPSYRKVLGAFYSFLALCTDNPFVLGHGINCETCVDHWPHLADHMGDGSGHHADTFDTMASLPTMCVVTQTWPTLMKEGIVSLEEE